MNKFLRNGLVLPVALGTLLATSLGAAASPARDPNPRQDRNEHRQDKREDKREARQERREDRQERREDRKDDRQDRRDDQRNRVVAPVIVRPGHPAVVRQDRRDDRQDRRQDRREDRREIRQDRRDDRRDIRQDRREVRHDIRQDRRNHQRYRDDYNRRLRVLQSRHFTPRYYHGGNYRYNRGGHWYRVNYYGADMLRQAVDQGYREGLRAGTADRYDGWRGDYRSSFAWIDASFGFRGNYVSRSEYNYYFRQGFERGYEDGLYGRSRYGRYVNGEAIIIDAVLGAILNLQRY
jgi:hypothetical protein